VSEPFRYECLACHQSVPWGSHSCPNPNCGWRVDDDMLGKMRADYMLLGRSQDQDFSITEAAAWWGCDRRTFKKNFVDTEMITPSFNPTTGRAIFPLYALIQLRATVRANKERPVRTKPQGSA
jgi:hypothetical protein